MAISLGRLTQHFQVHTLILAERGCNLALKKSKDADRMFVISFYLQDAAWRPDFDGHQSRGFCYAHCKISGWWFQTWMDHFPFFIYGILWDNPPTIDFICLKMGTLHQQPDLDSHETTFLTLPCNLAHTAGASRMTPLPFMSRHRGIWAAWTKAEEKCHG